MATVYLGGKKANTLFPEESSNSSKEQLFTRKGKILPGHRPGPQCGSPFSENADFFSSQTQESVALQLVYSQHQGESKTEASLPAAILLLWGRRSPNMQHHFIHRLHQEITLTRPAKIISRNLFITTSAYCSACCCSGHRSLLELQQLGFWWALLLLHPGGGCPFCLLGTPTVPGLFHPPVLIPVT